MFDNNHPSLLTALKKAPLVGVFAALGLSGANAQNPVAAWNEFLRERNNDNLANASLLDYSHAGYRFSNRPLPRVRTTSSGRHRVFNIVSLGADLSNNDDFDDEYIFTAIRRAEAHTRQGGDYTAVIFFPRGFYRVASRANAQRPFQIRGSRITMKGQGAYNGTNILIANHGFVDRDPDEIDQGPYRFQFGSDQSDSLGDTLANVTSGASRGAYTVTVSSTNNLRVGQYVNLTQLTPDSIGPNFGGRRVPEEWTITRRTGLDMEEKHRIRQISGNRVTFENPINLRMVQSDRTRLRPLRLSSEVGVEDIRFISGWKFDNRDFVHHENDFVDYAYRGLQFRFVRDGWIRNCVFDSWNECLNVDRSVACTVQNIRFIGKKGHAGAISSRSTGILWRNIVDTVDRGGRRNNRGQLHGPSIVHSTTNNIFWDCDINEGQSIDCHAFAVYGNLFDNIQGGTIDGGGGPISAFPNHGPDLCLWNFVYNERFNRDPRTFNFYNASNPTRSTFVNPRIVGFQNQSRGFRFANVGLNQSRGTQAYPRSLFEAQLQLRRSGTYIEASSYRPNFHAGQANDGFSETQWRTPESGQGEWLTEDFNRSRNVRSIVVDEDGHRIGNWRIDRWNGSRYIRVGGGTSVGPNRTLNVPDFNTRRYRFVIETIRSTVAANNRAVRIREMRANH